MGKSKREQRTREKRERTKAEFQEWASEVIEDAREFLETATPFETSLTLAEIGVSTTHRQGIEKVLDEAIDELLQCKLSPQQIVQGFLTHLLNCWKTELRVKGRECSTEDFAFLVEAARHYAGPWARKNRIKQELEQAESSSALGLTSNVCTAPDSHKEVAL